MPKPSQWEILDRWVWHANDRPIAEAWARQQRDSFARSLGSAVSARLFPRNVRAGGASVPVIVGVIRRPKLSDNERLAAAIWGPK